MSNDMVKPRLLYVDDEQDNLIVFRSAFRRDYEVFTALSGAEGLAALKKNEVDIIITDQRMPGMTGVEFLASVPDEPATIRMILTGFSDVEAVIAAINKGQVYRYITKPWDKNELKLTIDKAYESLELKRKNALLLEELKEANEYLERKVYDRTAEVQKQKEEIEKLLLNILPPEIAQELQQFGKAKARRYESATVLFADIQYFTKIAENMTPEKLVDELDLYFRIFDGIIARYNVEKIKTIGDAYLCAGGVPVPGACQPCDVVQAALDMQDAVATLKAERAIHSQPSFSFRIGIHTGPLVAGVVGAQKFAYDIWGDTVNIACRMEQAGETGKINISQSTYDHIKGHFNCFYRGKIGVKNKDGIDMYFVERRIENKIQNSAASPALQEV
jgi:class 3 adenylate cyclase/ActR/RegA family two-component response regulator